MVKITFIKNNVPKTVEVDEMGLSLLDIAIKHDIELVGNCGGACSCGTCHVIVDDKWLNKIDQSSEEEEDVLDIVFGITPNSRLGCQIIVNESLDGLIVTIPE